MPLTTMADRVKPRHPGRVQRPPHRHLLRRRGQGRRSRARGEPPDGARRRLWHDHGPQLVPAAPRRGSEPAPQGHGDPSHDVACLSFSDTGRGDRVHGAAARRGRAAALLAVGTILGVLVLVLVAGCGRGRLTYVNHRYRFTLTYDATLVPADHALPSVFAGGRPAYVIAFLDAAGAAGRRAVRGRRLGRRDAPADRQPVALIVRPGGRAAPATGGLRRPQPARFSDPDDDAAGGRTGCGRRRLHLRLGGTAVQALTFVLVKGCTSTR